MKLFDSSQLKNIHKDDSDNNNEEEIELKEKKIKILKKEINEILLQLKQGLIIDEKKMMMKCLNKL